MTPSELALSELEREESRRRREREKSEAADDPISRQHSEEAIQRKRANRQEKNDAKKM
jgi:hypothetical protein